jgi:hypothetical protein
MTESIANDVSVNRLHPCQGGCAIELHAATTLDAYVALCPLLARKRPDHYEPSIYRT